MGCFLKNGQYVGPSITFKLTNKQKQLIDHYRTCHLENFKKMNIYTPYIFKLTNIQKSRLKAKVGFSPETFQIYETYRGLNDAGPHWNLVLRISDNQIEVPIDLLVSVDDAKKAHEQQGWKINNPCFPKLN